MRLLYFGDPHKRVTTPENRTDDFKETQKRKTKEIINIGIRNKVSAFLQPGDFFDIPNPPLDFVAEEMKMWSGIDIFDILTKLTSGLPYETEKLVEELKSFVPMIGLAGNHELYGNNISTLPKTMIGFLNKLGLMKFATKDNPYYLFTDDGLKVAITGTHYHLDIDKPEHIDDYVVEEKLGDIHIHMVHGYLTDKSKGDMFHHTLIDQIKHTKADLTISGHDHIGFPITEVDGKYFVNPGAITRLSNDLKEINRKVKVLLIDITKEHGLRLKEMPLNSAVDGNLVLNRAKITERKEKGERLEEFKRTIREAGVRKATNITEIVRDIADNKNLPKAVKQNAIERLSEKMTDMKMVDEGLVTDAYVEKIIFENFQSHEYTELDLSKGFNVLVGESRQGKTSILRGFSWIYENKPAGKRIIRNGADYARVTIYLSNGYIISRYMESKRNGKNGYEITDPKTGEVEFHNTKILPEVQKIIGFNPLSIDKDMALNLNFMKQGAGWFLIGDQFSAPQRAKVIGGIYGTQYADSAIRDIDSATKKTNEEIKKAHIFLDDTNENLKQFEHLPDLNKAIQSVERLISEVEEMNIRRQKIEKLLSKHNDYKIQVDKNRQVLKVLTQLDEAQSNLSDIKEILIRRDNLKSLLKSHNENAGKLKKANIYLDSVKDFDKVVEMHQKTQALFIRKTGIEKNVSRRKHLDSEIGKQKKLIEVTINLPKAQRFIENLMKGYQKRKAIEGLVLKHQKISNSLKNQKKFLNATGNINLAIDKFAEIKMDLDKKKELNQKIFVASELNQKRKQNLLNLNRLKDDIINTERITEGEKLHEETIDMVLKLENLTKVVQKRSSILTNIEGSNKTIIKVSKELSTQVDSYKELLSEAGKCPVCYGEIDGVTVSRIVKEHIH